VTLRDHGGGLTVRRRHPRAGRDDLDIGVRIGDSRPDQLHAPLRLSERPVPSRASSGNSGPRGAVGLADLPDEAPAQHEQVTKQGVDRVNRGAARPPGGRPVPCRVPVCPLRQRRAEHARAVSQARRGSLMTPPSVHVPASVSRGMPTVVGGHARKPARVRAPGTRSLAAVSGHCPESAGGTFG
jgi:hypothetical protein